MNIRPVHRLSKAELLRRIKKAAHKPTPEPISDRRPNPSDSVGRRVVDLDRVRRRCSHCGGPLTRGADAVSREMARRQGDTIHSGVTIFDVGPEPMCWACAFALAAQWRERVQEEQS